MRKTLATIAAATLALTLSACGGSETPTVETVTVQAESTPESGGGLSDREIARMAMDMSWDQIPADDRVTMCEMWDTNSDLVVEMMMEVVGNEIGAHRDDVRDHFEERC